MLFQLKTRKEKRSKEQVCRLSMELAAQAAAAVAAAASGVTQSPTESTEWTEGASRQ